jgi:hypothetical protein
MWVVAWLVMGKEGPLVQTVARLRLIRAFPISSF